MAVKTIAGKLGIKPGQRVAIINAPAGYVVSLRSACDGCSVVGAGAKTVDVAQLFVTTEKDLKRDLPGATATVRSGGILWVCYPKRSGPVRSELNRDVIRGLMPAFGLQVVSLVAIDDTWSALRVKPLT